MDNQSQKKITFQALSANAYSLCICILLTFALFIGLFLAYYSARYSYYSSTDYQIPVYLVKDNALVNLLLFAGVCLLAMLLNYLFQKLGAKQRLAGYIFLGLCCILYVTVCLIWVRDLPYYPSGDQLNATAAAHYNLDGNFIMFKKSGYIGKFPYQKGLAFLYEILFTLFGHFCYPVAAKFHIFFGVITMVFGYLFVEETSWNSICKILYCPLVLFCTPYLILTPYTYGDLPSICFCTVMFWALLRYVRTLKIRYVALTCVMAALSLMVRMHTWIVLIAILIGMVLAAWQKKKLQPILAGLLVTVSAFSAIKALDYSYALRSGYEITQGAPMILTVAMGLQDNYNGPGTYNDYQTTTMGEADWDIEVAKEIARENIRENVDHFKSDPEFAKWFFKTKLLMQWIEPSFETLMSTRSFDEKKPMPDWIEQVYYGSLHDPLMKFANNYQSIIYLGFVCFLPVLWKRRRENAAGWIPLIAIVGGFLFSIIWEAQCRYVLPYYLFMLVYVPDGIHCVGDLLRKGFRRSAA